MTAKQSDLTKARAALRRCVTAMLKMIPEACAEAHLKACTNRDHDRAIAEAAAVLYGADRATWPPHVRKAAEGGYA